ncbi:MAG: ribonuclease III [Caldisericia bacterium]
MRDIKEFIEFLEKNYLIKIKNIDLVQRALIHTSKEIMEPPNNFERLEFLGDSIINFIVSYKLFKEFKNKKEGFLSKNKSLLISKELLSIFAKELKIDQFIILGKGEEIDKGREKSNILCDAFEAVIAAIFLDSGIRNVKKLLNKLIDDFHNETFFDSKTLLQEITQEKFKSLPTYELIETTGEEHNKIFKIGVYINDKLYGIGSGKSKKEAEKEAAKNSIFILKDEFKKNS